VQGHISLFPDMWEWIDDNRRKQGKSRSELIEDMLTYSMEHEYKDMNPVSNIKAYKMIGESSKMIGGRVFAISSVPEKIDKYKKGYDECLRRKYISKKTHRLLVKELDREMKRNIKIELSKKRKKRSDEKSSETVEQEPEIDREKLRLVVETYKDFAEAVREKEMTTNEAYLRVKEEAKQHGIPLKEVFREVARRKKGKEQVCAKHV